MTTIRVVAAALLRAGPSGPVVLAARRARPAPLAGGWEFPGGKVETGETDEAALRRECREELGIAVVPGECLGTASDGAIDVVLYAASTDDAPRLGPDHDELRPLGADELQSIRWLPIDTALLPAVQSALRRANRQGTVSRSDNDAR